MHVGKSFSGIGISAQLVLADATVSNVLPNVILLSMRGNWMKGIGHFTPTGVYREETFRYILESEFKRSARSGYLYQLLLVYRTDVQGVIVPMDPDIAKTVIAALSRILRDTDYIGWYREGRVVGGVLTVLGRDSVADVCKHLRPRLMDILRAELGVEESHRFQIRVYQHHELKEVELSEQSCGVN